MSSDLYVPGSCRMNQEFTASIIRKISSAISISASIYIVLVIFQKWKKKRSSIDSYQRIMLGLSISDALYSFFFWFMGSWMTPAETGWWGAVGNTQSCSAQGFFWYFGVMGVSCYQIALSLQLMLLVTHGWSGRKFERVIERWMHWAIFILALLWASIPLIFQSYNATCGFCTVSPLPTGCGGHAAVRKPTGGPNVECLRGSPTVAQVCFYAQWLMAMGVTLFCTVAMYKVYQSVRAQEKRSDRFRFGGESHNCESKRIRKTMLLYTSSFYICWLIPPILWYTPHRVTALWLVADALFPLQGFFNLLVFIQPKCVKYQKEHPGTSLLMAYFCVIFEIDKLKQTIKRFATGRKSTPATIDDEADDGIGFGDYNEEPTSTNHNSTAHNVGVEVTSTSA